MSYESVVEKEFHLPEMEAVFKRLCKKIRKHVPEDILNLSISLLNQPNATSIENIVHYKPWELLILIKWTFLYGDYSSPKRRHVSGRDFDDMRKHVYDLSGKSRMPSQYENVFLFLRNIAFQQFWLQGPFSATEISRQSLLFGHLEKHHPFEKIFQQETNLSINEFIELSFALITRVFNKDFVFTADWFSTIQDTFSKGATENFLNCLSKDINGIKSYLRENTGKINLSYEFYEQSPLKRYPLLKIGETYRYYSPVLLIRSMETYIYDTLRIHDPHSFMDKFGSAFEEYVEKGIQYTDIPYLKESDLKKYSNGGKTTDFVLVDEGINILIDAKGVEMGYLGMVSHLPNVIKDKTKVSVIKGIKQGYETVKLLRKVSLINGIEIGKEDSFLLIVTFKDLYIGNGKDFQSYIAKYTFESIDAEYGEQLIPPQNMYFISINDLDEFFLCIKRGYSARAILQRVVNDDKKPETVKFVFRQHLVEYLSESERVPQYLENEYASIIDNIKSRFDLT